MVQQINQANPHPQVFAVNGSAGAFVPITAQTPSGYIEVVECPPAAGAFDNTNFAPQGLNYSLAEDGFVAIYAALPGEVIPLGTKDGPNRSISHRAMTDPAGNAIAATTYMKVRSATATATQVMLREWPQR